VTNPANYLLVEDGVNGTFDTTSCLGGLATDDIQINISSVTYFSRTAVISLSIIPPVGNYRLFVCGTTSIVDLVGNPLAGNGVTSGTDHILNFVVGTTTPIAPTTETENITVSNLPKTGFAPNKITSLPPQPATLEYAKLGDIVLEIPSLNVKSSIVGVPQTNGGWDVTWLGNDIGWLNGTAFPTWTGNSVLTAHVTNASGLDGPFAALKELKYGDQVIVHIGGVRYVYEIRNTKLVRPYSTSFAFESLPEHSYLTLITCQGYNPLNETYLFRRVVRAVLIRTESD
jgi:LPXTG-site transpeptidase (sortase) family protein